MGVFRRCHVRIHHACMFSLFACILRYSRGWIFLESPRRMVMMYNLAPTFAIKSRIRGFCRRLDCDCLAFFFLLFVLACLQRFLFQSWWRNKRRIYACKHFFSFHFFKEKSLLFLAQRLKQTDICSVAPLASYAEKGQKLADSMPF